MKRMTALALAGMLFFGTACGGNQTNSEAAKADAGAAAVQETAEGAEEAASSEAEEAADSSAAAKEGSRYSGSMRKNTVTAQMWSDTSSHTVSPGRQ